MVTAKLFKNGRSQAVRLPKEFRIPDQEVYITKVDGVIMLIPLDDPWAGLKGSLDRFSDDFMEDRENLPVQSRDLF